MRLQAAVAGLQWAHGWACPLSQGTRLFVSERTVAMKSPYKGSKVEKWETITRKILESHPIDTDEFVQIVLSSWKKIFKTKIGGELQIGEDVFPTPQILGNYLHLLIAATLEKAHPTIWRRERDKNDKDVVCLTNNDYSFEIKTSSQNRIFGNRSYGQAENASGKSKSGFYAAVLFEKCTPQHPTPAIKRIKFGWIDHTDWKAQAAATGQNSTLDTNAWNLKLKDLYTAE